MINMPGLMLIDDNKDELKEIHDALCKAAIPSLPILFDPITPSGLDHVDLECFCPRVIISDLNLRPAMGSFDVATFYPIISSMLRKINPTKPYVIYFWSTHDDLVDGVMEQVLKSLKPFNILPPMGFGTLKRACFRGRRTLKD